MRIAGWIWWRHKMRRTLPVNAIKMKIFVAFAFSTSPRICTFFMWQFYMIFTCLEWPNLHVVAEAMGNKARKVTTTIKYIVQTNEWQKKNTLTAFSYSIKSPFSCWMVNEISAGNYRRASESALAQATIKSLLEKKRRKCSYLHNFAKQSARICIY